MRRGETHEVVSVGCPVFGLSSITIPRNLCAAPLPQASRLPSHWLQARWSPQRLSDLRYVLVAVYQASFKRARSESTVRTGDMQVSNGAASIRISGVFAVALLKFVPIAEIPTWLVSVVPLITPVAVV